MSLYRENRFSFAESEDQCKNMNCCIPSYGQDHNYADAAEQGEDTATHTRNIPAIMAAKTAGGIPFAQTVANGVNRVSPNNTLHVSEVNPKFHFDDGDDDDDDQEDSYGDDDDDYEDNKRKAHHESVCSVLSRCSR